MVEQLKNGDGQTDLPKSQFWKENEEKAIKKLGKTGKSISEKQPLKTNRPKKENYRKINLYKCDKITFKSRKHAFDSIVEGGDIKSLRPYKCERCDGWHLTHKKVRVLWLDKKCKRKALRPCDYLYKPKAIIKPQKPIIKNVVDK